MSILADANELGITGITLLAIGSILSAYIVYALRLNHLANVRGPLRLRPNRPIGNIAAIGCAGLMVWLGAQAVFGVIKATRWKHAGHTDPLTAAAFTVDDYAFLVTAPGLMAFATLIIGSLRIPNLPDQLGFAPRRLPAGVRKGLIGAIVAITAVLWVSIISEWVYRRIGYVHPPEYDVLKMMKAPGGMMNKSLLIFGAVIVAPLWEELFFRGFLQSLLLRIRAYRAVPAMAPATAEIGSPVPPPVEQSYAPSVARTWLAIIITSIFFALVHPAWTMPSIFALSICLGYAYERTGNLWTNVTMHLMFNLFSTTLYLLTSQ